MLQSSTTGALLGNLKETANVAINMEIYIAFTFNMLDIKGWRDCRCGSTGQDWSPVSESCLSASNGDPEFHKREACGFVRAYCESETFHYICNPMIVPIVQMPTLRQGKMACQRSHGSRPPETPVPCRETPSSTSLPLKRPRCPR